MPAAARAASDHFTLTPCRVLSAALIGPPPTTVTLRGVCGVPLWATSVTANLTVLAPSAYGFVQIVPAGRTAGTSTHNYRPGKTRSNNFTTALSATGQVSLSSSSSISVHLDVRGYYGVSNSWHVAASYPSSQFTTIEYYGFPSAMQATIPNGTLEVYAANPVVTNQQVCPSTKANNIQTIRTLGGFPATYTAQAGDAVNKLLFSGASQLFTDPTTGIHYNGALYYDTQAVPWCGQGDCGIDAKWAAYTNDGITFTPGRKIFDYCDVFAPCTTNWFCDHGFPCDSAMPRGWWTGAIVGMAPVGYISGAFYALAATFEVQRPGRPLISNPQLWTLVSNDGNTWTPYLQVYWGAIDPSWFQPSCLTGPWFLNQDMAYDPATDTYYFTRAYSDNYAGCPPPFGNDPAPPATTLPNRIQLFKAQGPTAFHSGTWTKLLDLGCGELGFQPDSAEIKHDGLGNVIPYGSGLTLYIGVSGANGTDVSCSGGSVPDPKGSCGPPPSGRVQVVTVIP
jgi:hypothetical protein